MNKEFVTNATEITKLAAAIFSGESRLHGDRATYLRSLVAGVQSELTGKPILRVSGRPRRPDLDGTIAAFERTNEAFYAAVVAAIPEGLNAAERQSKTSFARSAAATLRRAIKTGWNPLGVAATGITKGELAAWTKAHSAPRPLTTGAAERRVAALTERIAGILDALPKDDGARILSMALEGLGQQAPQRLTNVSLRRQQPTERIAAH